MPPDPRPDSLGEFGAQAASTSADLSLGEGAIAGETGSSWSVRLAATATAPLLARRGIRRWLEGLVWPAEGIDDIEYAVNEAVSNAAEHAYPAEDNHTAGGGEVEVTAVVETQLDGSRRVRALVSDHGRWRPVPVAHEDRRRGIAMMSVLMDEVSVRPGDGDAGRGTEVMLLSPEVPPLP
jgi:anti-sigma regulatory factor (Ser/Thr protein kinase)